MYADICHPPHRGCGLKFPVSERLRGHTQSPPSQGVWIEIRPYHIEIIKKASPPSQGVWIEICPRISACLCPRRSPPSQGVWIEILAGDVTVGHAVGHPPHRGCGLKYRQRGRPRGPAGSPPSQGVWIEITRKTLETKS